MVEFSERSFDVIKFAKQIMDEIESVRSFKQQNDEKTGEGFQLPTESRINAFFRLIGLPYFVVIKDGKENESTFLHPNFSISVRSKLVDKTIIDSEQEYTYINGESSRIDKVLYDRSKYLTEMSNRIGNSDMNENISKAMYAPIDIQPNIPNKLFGKGEFIPKIPPNNGNDTENKREVFKKLFPLIPSVSDNSTHRVLPLRNEIARPFVFDVKDRRIDRDTILRKPFLEQVIRIRFLKFGNSEDDEDLEKDISNSIKNLIGEKDYSNIFGDNGLFSRTTVLEEFIINKFLNAIVNLARRWVRINEDRINLLRRIKPTINIKTSSARVSEFGKRVDLSVELEGTSEGEKIRSINTMISKDEALLALLPSDEDDQVNVKQSKTRNITPNALQNPFINLITYDLDKNKETKSNLEENIKKDIKRLEKIRLEVVDLMTGEFTGLSLPDIVIVMASLFIIDRDYLLDLLDKYAIDSMKTDKVLKEVVGNKVPNSTNAMTAIQQLENVVSQLYKVFHSQVQLSNDRRSRGRKGPEKKIYNDKTSQVPKAPTCTRF